MADDKKSTATDQQAASQADKHTPPSAAKDAAPSSPQHPSGPTQSVRATSDPIKIGQPSAPDEEKESTLPKGAKVGGQDAEVPEPGNKIDWPEVPDPYQKIEVEPRRFGVHEGVERHGAVPLPVGHQLNEPGAIPRSPGEWPHGGHTPENPLGRTVPGMARPASESGPEAARKMETRKLIDAEAEQKGVSPLHPDIDHKKAEAKAAENVAKQAEKK